MAQALGKKAAQSMFAKHIAAIEPTDPLYEETTDARGRRKRVRRQLPPGLSKRDQAILKKIKKRAHYLDKGISLCGFRVGWTFWIGLIPGAGDVADACLNYFLVLRPAKKAEIPDWISNQMVVNNAISAGVGLIPIVGDVVLGVWKANSRNAHILEEYLAIRGQEYLIELGYSVPSTTSGITRNDAKIKEQYKPGAGLAHNEVVSPPNADGTNTKQKGGMFGRLLGKNGNGSTANGETTYGATGSGSTSGNTINGPPQVPVKSGEVYSAKR